MPAKKARKWHTFLVLNRTRTRTRTTFLILNRTRTRTRTRTRFLSQIALHHPLRRFF